MRIATLVLFGVIALEQTASAQSMLGDEVTYADEGVYEVGATGSVSWGDDRFGFGIGPSVGWFVEDNIELSALGDIIVAFPDDDDAQLAGSVVFEPSYHLPLSGREDAFGFAGLGAGVGTNGEVFGFQLVPRAGFNFPVGQGVLTPAARVPVFFSEDGTSVGLVLEAGASAIF